MAITTLRSELISITKNIISFISQRKDLVAKIQEIKQSENLNTFIPSREAEVYKMLESELKNFSDKELLSISLLIEEQAGESYPQWSQGTHLESRTNKLIDLINPLMLLILRPTSFKMLTLKKEYQELINER